MINWRQIDFIGEILNDKIPLISGVVSSGMEEVDAKRMLLSSPGLRILYSEKEKSNASANISSP